MASASELRQLTSVSTEQYTIDDTTYWTDDQLTAVLADHDDDIHGAASEVFTSWAAAVATAYDVTMDGQTLSRSQMSDRLTKLAKQEADLSAAGVDVESGGIKSIEAPAPMGRTENEGWPGFEESS